MMTVLISAALTVLAASSAVVVDATPLQARASVPIPGGKKAGSAGGRALPHWQNHLGWWYDWTPTPDSNTNVYGMSMLWGDGQNGPQDSKRFNEFKNLKTVPKYLLGFNEPDCNGTDTSAKMSVADGIHWWNELIVPKGEQGSLLGSPSMCAQKDEVWLKRFKVKLGEGKVHRDFDFTAIHVYKDNMDGVRADIDYYWNTYNKPILVTEFGCVNDRGGFNPCTSQSQINQWINDVVDVFQNDDRVIGYAYTDGALSKNWQPTNNDGSQLSESGRTYLSAISRYG